MSATQIVAAEEGASVLHQTTSPPPVNLTPQSVNADRPEAASMGTDGEEPAGELSRLRMLEAVFKHLPEGVAVLDADLSIRWCNDKFLALCSRGDVVGLRFSEAFGGTEELRAVQETFSAALNATETVLRRFRVGDRLHFELRISPVRSDGVALLSASVRDISGEVQERQKLTAIYSAGMELGQITAEELQQLSVADRIELLKQRIIQFTKDVFHFETIEVRMLDKSTRQLEPLLNVGMREEAAARMLYADVQGNGVTGYVAAKGVSYLCDDASKDPLYLPGAPNARSSLTVPLILDSDVFGTFNVESDRVGAFTEQDLRFLELFGREVAMAIHTLELLEVEKITAATKSAGMIFSEVVRPVDEILNDTAWILDRYIGHDPAVCERLQKVRKHTRNIKTLIQNVGEALTPASPHGAVTARTLHPLLRSKRILVVDNDQSVRDHAHAALGQIGCEVETVQNGEEALLMARSFHYDVALVDIRLPDMTGYDCFVQLRNIHEHLPVILMTGFGYDPGHSIVKARQAGLKSALYKPFRLDQMLTELELAISAAPSKPAAS